MKKLFTYFLSISVIMLIFLTTSIRVEAQPADGKNFDFALGDFTNWKGYQSKTTSTAILKQYNPASWIYFTDPTTSEHRGKTCFIVNSSYSQYDMNVGATKLIKIPSFLAYNKSVQINVDEAGANANYLSYDILLTKDNCMVTFNYAMVLEAPGHSGYQNPFFEIEAMELDDNDLEVGRLHPATFFEVVGELPAPEGWSAFQIGSKKGIWQNWRQLSMDLSDYVSKKVRLKILITGCSPTAHWAYGYFVGKVAPSEVIINSCKNPDTIATLMAPPGFAKYEWFENPNNLPESQLNTIAVGTPLSESQAAGAIPARFIYNVLERDSLSENLFVKLTSLANLGNSPMETFIKVRPYNTKPIAEFGKGGSANLMVYFVNLTKFPKNDPDAEIEYIWDFGDGTELLLYNSNSYPVEENINPKHQYYDSAAYNVTLTAKYNGCATTFRKTVIPSYVGLDDLELENIDISIYPNPATNQTNIKVKGVNGNAKMIIYDELGKIVDSYNVTPFNGLIEKNLDIKKYEKGVYLIKIIGEDINTSKKLIVQ